jgi:hypothetical protein
MKKLRKLKPERAFLHIINDHRWLAASGCSWNLLMANKGDNPVRTEADKLLPDVIVAVRDCVLLQARSLIDFYTKCRAQDTDILLCDFHGLSIDPIFKDRLEKYKKPIEVHLLHLTAWRDRDYRQHATREYRPNWDEEIPGLVVSVIEALKCVSEKGSRWKEPFTELYNACLRRYEDKSSKWPAILDEESAVEGYLMQVKAAGARQIL